MKTQTVAGHEITLKAGKQYRASRPMADNRRRTVYPVSITEIGTGKKSARAALVIDGLNYDQANMLLHEFNNGVISFVGRVW